MTKSTKNLDMSEMKIDLAVIKERVLSLDSSINSKIDSMSKTMEQINKSIVKRQEIEEQRLDNHLIADTKWKGEKDGSIIGLKWALSIGFSIITIGLTILANLI